MQPEPFPTMGAPLGGSGGRDVPTSRLIRPPSWQATAHDLLNRPSSSRTARNVQIATMAIIVVSSLAFVLQSEPSLASWGGWEVIDISVAILFTVEYVLRLYVAPYGRGDEVYEQDHRATAGSVHYSRRTPSLPATPFQARLRCALQPLVLVDLAAIIPFWLGLFLFFLPNAFLSPIRMLRLVRILRMLRLAQESQELRSLALCARRCLPALRLLLFFVGLEVLIFGGFAFHAEAGSLILDYRGRGPVWVVEDLSARGPIDDELTPASLQSIRDGAWWALVTVTTVGYGDAVPHTSAGRAVAAVAMFTGVVGISMSFSIISQEMSNVRHGERSPKTTSHSENDLSGGGTAPLMAVRSAPSESIAPGISRAAVRTTPDDLDREGARDVLLRLEQRLSRLEELLDRMSTVVERQQPSQASHRITAECARLAAGAERPTVHSPGACPAPISNVVSSNMPHPLHRKIDSSD